MEVTEEVSMIVGHRGFLEVRDRVLLRVRHLDLGHRYPIIGLRVVSRVAMLVLAEILHVRRAARVMGVNA